MDDAIRFIVNGETATVTDAAPMTTLLDWLRYEKRLTGTKEGCAEGDCGACTVAIRELGPDGEMVQRTANACILLLPMLHGREVVTVEHLARDGAPHPVQEAMAGGRGAQCGFCTPGFVVSLWHGYETSQPTDADSVADQLAGNLCRCTGYGPILDAAPRARRMAAASSDREVAKARLTALETAALDYRAAGARLIAPRSADAFAAAYAEHPDATILAGATDIGLWVTKRGFAPDLTLHIGDCADLKVIEETEAGLRFGAAVTHDAAMAALAPLAADLGELWRRFASPQVRASGTLCGNIANGSPIGDAPPALIALGATLTLRKGDARREMPLEDFFIDYGKQDRAPGEFVESVFVPRPAETAEVRVYKLSKRFDQDITSALVAAMLDFDGDRVKTARIALGGMAGVPRRARAAEAALVGGVFDDAAIGAAMKALESDAAPMDDHRASAAYRMKAAQNALLKVYLEHRFGPQRVTGETRLTLETAS